MRRVDLTAALFMGFLALISVSATCENQDYFLPAQITLDQSPPFVSEAVHISQPYQGLNSLDYEVVNSGSEEAEFGIAVFLSCDLPIPYPGGARGETWCHHAECCPFLVATHVVGPLAPGEQATGRFSERDLGLGQRMEVDFLCYQDAPDPTATCSGTLELFLQLRQVECRVDADCSSDELCALDKGICELNPEESSGCQIARADEATHWLSLLIVGSMLFGVLLRRNVARNSKGCRKSRNLILILFLLLVPTTSEADTPADFRRAHVYVQPSFRVSQFIGQLADYSSMGVGMALTQGFQFGHFGLNLGLSTDLFLTEQTPPPYGSGLQIASFRGAGRYVYPFGDFRPFAEVSFQRISFISNALVEITGADLAHHSVGAAVGLRLVHLSSVYLEVSGRWDWMFDLSDTHLFGVDIAIGLRSQL